MSSTQSPNWSGPTKAGTHNSSTVQRSWRRSLYLLIIRSWRADEMEFQCRLARFVISNKCVMRCWLAANLTGRLKGTDYSDEKGEQPPRKRGAPDGECCVEKRSTKKVLKEHRMKKSAKSRLRSANGDWGAPVLAEERRKGVWGVRVRSAEFNIEATIQTEVCR